MVSRRFEELISVMPSMLASGALAAQSNYLWVNIMAIVVIGLVALGCAVALKKT